MTKHPSTLYQRLVRPLAACACLVLCLFCAWVALHVGLSRMFSVYAAKTGRLDAAETATSITPLDPQAHFVRAELLKEEDRLEEAVKEFEEAAMLRPRDYGMCLELGLARDQKEDQDGALVALREAVRLAPEYSEPRWQLGNVELRGGLIDEAFVDLRRAALSRPSLLPQLIDLAWSVSDGNVPAVERAVEAQTSSSKLALARFLAKHGKTVDAARIFRTIEKVSEEERDAFLTELLAARQFHMAYEVWSAEATKRGERDANAIFTNGGFEEKIDLKEQGFGWQIARDAAMVQVSIDNAQPHGGSSSLRLDWKGDSNPSSALVSQLVLVEPSTRYRLSFAARTDQLITGGLPLISITGASDSHELAHSAPFQQRTSPWQDYAIEFTTGKEVQAVQVSLRRQNCSSSPCPVFGSLWLDDFALQKI